MLYHTPTYENANFIHKALIMGFEPYPKYFNPNDNWFGVSAISDKGHTPDAKLTRGNKKIILSLQGTYMPFPKEITPQWESLAKQIALKYLGFYEGDQIKYETWFGNLPSNEFIERFIVK